MHATSREDHSLQGSFIMRKISLFLLLVSLFVFFSSSLSAAPATKGICEGAGLKAKGVTNGLFGLCVAYCEAGANSERVLENYNLKKKDSDPAMPCLTDTEPTLSCECWNTLTASQIGEGMSPSSCALDPAEDALYYEDGLGGVEYLTVSSGACFHYNSLTGDFSSVQNLEPDHETVCRGEILLDLAVRDFSGSEFSCLPPPP
jgi:hypothetical protein